VVKKVVTLVRPGKHSKSALFSVNSTRMTSTEVLSTSPYGYEVAHSALIKEVPLTALPLCSSVDHALSEGMTTVQPRRSHLRQDTVMEGKQGKRGSGTLLDVNTEAQDLVSLDVDALVDRGPGANDKFIGTWQHQATGKLAAAAVLAECGAVRVKSGGVKGMTEEGLKSITGHELDDTFYVVDLGNTLRLLKAWRAAMPRIVPFYAVKCNPEPNLLKLLIAMGTGFDCASKGELEIMLKMGVPPSRIIFAHPCKRATDIKYAREHNVALTTFDTESELHKLAAMYPQAKCVLRIRADDPEARCPLGLKYGANPEEAPALLATAKKLGLDVVGVSFHVGSACKNLPVFSMAIEKAREIFDLAKTFGYDMELLDIGGGFTGHFDSHGNVMFGEIASTINTAIATHFPPEMGVRIIAEPGRFFAETSATLFTPVYGQKDRADESGNIRKDYWITDGLYGSFNCIIYDYQNPEYKVVRSPLLPAPTSHELHLSTIWGPTCDSADCVYKDVMLPQLRNGDWLMFPDAGAYTIAGACDFNGICATRPSTFYVCSDSAVDMEEVVGDAMVA
jgi:ornithine decarboxylase